jgi:hypothetical protein
MRMGVSESTASRTVKRVENMLIESGNFSLPLKRELQGSDVEVKVVAVDVTEVEIERPKKTARVLQWQTEVSHSKSTGNNKCRDFRDNFDRFRQREEA